MSIEKELIPYKEAFALKELGFDEPCFEMSEHKKLCNEQSKPEGCQLHNLRCAYPNCTIDKSIIPIPLPTFSQAFRFFRENYGLHSNVKCINTTYNNHFRFEIESNSETLYCRNLFDTHEEAELACLEKLIEIVETKSE